MYVGAKFFGYDRLIIGCLAERINAFYREYWEPFHNHFLPSAKPAERYSLGVEVKGRRYEPGTPIE